MRRELLKSLYHYDAKTNVWTSLKTGRQVGQSGCIRVEGEVYGVGRLAHLYVIGEWLAPNEQSSYFKKGPSAEALKAENKINALKAEIEILKKENAQHKKMLGEIRKVLANRGA